MFLKVNFFLCFSQLNSHQIFDLVSVNKRQTRFFCLLLLISNEHKGGIVVFLISSCLASQDYTEGFGNLCWMKKCTMAIFERFGLWIFHRIWRKWIRKCLFCWGAKTKQKGFLTTADFFLSEKKKKLHEGGNHDNFCSKFMSSKANYFC